MAPAPPRDDEELAVVARGLSHPTRIAILRALRDAPEPIGPKQTADVLGISLGKVSYHFRALEDLGFVELAETIPRRGALEHRYRFVPRGHAACRLL